MENWVPCKYFSTYEVSDLGRIRNRRTGRILKTYVNSHGYEQVQLHHNSRYYTKKVHRLIADSFYNAYSSDLDINHKDGNKLNNHLDNLEYCTRSENIKHAFANGLNRSYNKKKVLIVELNKVFDSITECSEYLGVDRTSVSFCVRCNGRTCRGYHIVYA